MPLRVINIIPPVLNGETNFDSEPSITVNPSNPRQLVISAFTPNTAAPVTTGQYFFSANGGTTWALNAVIPGGTATFGTKDISVRFGGSSGVLYAGILRGDSTLRMNILRKANFAGPGLMTVLVDRTQEDQPWVEAATVPAPREGFLAEVGPLPAGAQQVGVAPLSDGRLQLWAVDGQGGLRTTWKTTTDPNAAWVPWADFLAEVGALPAGAQQVAVAPLPDGRLQLWAVDAAGGLFSTWKATTDPNAAWVPWANFLTEVGALPAGARQVGVAPLPDGRLQLWTVDGAGGLFTTWKTTTDPNANWVPWANFLTEVGALPAGARQVGVAPLSDGRLQLWAVDGQGGLFTTWKTTTDPNAAWVPWADFLAEVGALPAGARQVGVAPLSDGRLQLWAVDGQGGLRTTWKATTDPNAAWVSWTDFLAEVGALPAGAQQVGVAPLSDGRLQLWAVDAAGGLFSTWKTTTDPNAAWVPWADSDRVYVSSNDLSQRPNGRTASVDFSLNAAPAAAPAGFFSTARLETRTSAALPNPPAGPGGRQDGPSVRTAIHRSGVLYGAFFGWRTFGSLSLGTPNVTDVVVVRDDNWASGTTQFQALIDPGDHRAGLRVVTGRQIAPLGTMLGTQRVGTSLAIAVDPRNSQTVYLAWCDGLATTASPYTLRVRRSDDGGRHWSGDLLTVSDATNPGLTVNARGTAALLYQQLVNVSGTNRWQTHLVKSVDGFATVFSDTTLADVLDSSTGASTTVVIGDYDNLVAVGKDFYGVFSAHNVPASANFPAGVTYLRNANFATQQLLAVNAVGNVIVVSPSVDPFFFHDQAIEPTPVAQVGVASLSDGRLQLWAASGAGGLFSTWKATTDPNANWVPWANFLTEVGALSAGARQVGVAPLPDGRLQLWAVDSAGGLFSTWKTTTDPNAAWVPWANFLTEVGALPAGARQVGVAPLSDGRLQLWAVDGQGGLRTTWKTTTDPNANWVPWEDFLTEVGALSAGARQVGVAPLSDGRLQLWAVDGQGGLFTTWKTTTDPNAGWVPWADFLAEVGAPPAGARQVGVAPLSDGRLQLWAVDGQGGLRTTWKTTTDPNAAWVPWADFLAEV